MKDSKIAKFEELNALWWANRFDIKLTQEPSNEPIILCSSDSSYLLQIIRNYLGYIIVADISLYSLIRDINTEIDLKSITESVQGRECLNEYISSKRLQTKLVINKFYHAIGLACDKTTAIQTQEIVDRVVRIEPGHKFWHVEDTPPERPFKYIAIEDGKDIAQCSVMRLVEFDSTLGSAWALGVGVRPEYRRREYGRAVASAATKECVDLGGVALWNAEIDNFASLRICKSLGYKEHSWYLFINK